MAGPYRSTQLDPDELGKLADKALRAGDWETHRAMTHWAVLVEAGELTVSRCIGCPRLHAMAEAFCSQECQDNYQRRYSRAYTRWGSAGRRMDRAA